MSTWEGPGVKDKELGLGSGWLPQCSAVHRQHELRERRRKKLVGGRQDMERERKELDTKGHIFIIPFQKDTFKANLESGLVTVRN